MLKQLSCVFVSGMILAGAASQTNAAIATFQQGANSYTSGKDASLYSPTPEHNYGGATDLFVLASGDVAHPQGQAILLFDSIFGNGAGQVPVGSTINSATVTLVSRSDSVGHGTIHKSFWSPIKIAIPNFGDNDGPADVGEVDYRYRKQNQEGWGTANTGATGPIRNEDFFGTGITTQINYNSGADQAINFTSAGLTAIVQSWALGAYPNYGFHISPHGGALDNDLDNYGGTATFFYSNEAAQAFRPILTIDYTPVPEPAAMGLLAIGGAMMLRRRSA